jgi:hypothetical protein
MAYLEERRNIGDVANVVEQLGNDLAASNYDAAYARFSDDFRARVDKSEFTSKFEQFQGFFGKIQGMRWNLAHPFRRR